MYMAYDEEVLKKADKHTLSDDVMISLKMT